MSKFCYRECNLRPAALQIIQLCNGIIAKYVKAGLRLTLRQLYYQLVTRNAITNEEKSYKRLGGIVSDGRLAGLMDWDAIEDRVRTPRQASQWNDVADLVDSALQAYRLPRWHGQENYVELWVEKDALAGVLWPIAFRYHVTLMVNRGYSSQSAMYESANRIIGACDEGQQPVILYLGDHDPSGEDMVRDIRDRLEMFQVRDLEVRKVALTTEQVQEYNPPPNPAKLTDPRAAAYIRRHGPVSWEVDALPPEVLAQIIDSEFAGLVDMEKMDRVKEQEEKDKKRLRDAAAKMPKPKL